MSRAQALKNHTAHGTGAAEHKRRTQRGLSRGGTLPGGEAETLLRVVGALQTQGGSFTELERSCPVVPDTSVPGELPGVKPELRLCPRSGHSPLGYFVPLDLRGSTLLRMGPSLGSERPELGSQACASHGTGK